MASEPPAKRAKLEPGEADTDAPATASSAAGVLVKTEVDGPIVKSEPASTEQSSSAKRSEEQLNLHTKFRTVLKALYKEDADGVFAAPVPESIPGYRTVVVKILKLTPCDFGTIKSRIQSLSYADCAAFAEDLFNVFRCCASFNPPGTLWHTTAIRIAGKLPSLFQSAGLTDDSVPGAATAKSVISQNLASLSKSDKELVTKRRPDLAEGVTGVKVDVAAATALKDTAADERVARRMAARSTDKVKAERSKLDKDVRGVQLEMSPEELRAMYARGEVGSDSDDDGTTDDSSDAISSSGSESSDDDSTDDEESAEDETGDFVPDA